MQMYMYMVRVLPYTILHIIIIPRVHVCIIMYMYMYDAGDNRARSTNTLFDGYCLSGTSAISYVSTFTSTCACISLSQTTCAFKHVYMRAVNLNDFRTNDPLPCM